MPEIQYLNGMKIRFLYPPNPCRAAEWLVQISNINWERVRNTQDWSPVYHRVTQTNWCVSVLPERTHVRRHTQTHIHHSTLVLFTYLRMHPNVKSYNHIISLLEKCIELNFQVSIYLLCSLCAHLFIEGLQKIFNCKGVPCSRRSGIII